MGFTQRQAAGKFTRDEADAFIARLEAAAEGADVEPAAPAPRRAAGDPLRKFSSPELAAELQRRGWIVAEP